MARTMQIIHKKIDEIKIKIDSKDEVRKIIAFDYIDDFLSPQNEQL